MAQRFSLDPRILSREEPISFPGPPGRLEGLWRPPKPGAKARGVVVVAHPHPSHGGTMANKVVFHMARVMNHDLDVAALRFNFRGVGASDGEFDHGNGEIEDVAAAWAEARRRMPGSPLVAAGFSFGAAMTLLAASRAEDPPRGLALVGIPPGMFSLPDPFPTPIPLAAVHGETDQFTPPGDVEQYLANWPGQKQFHVEPGADHFLEGRLVEPTAFLSDAVDGWL